MRCYLHELKSCHTVKTIMSDPALSLLRGIYVYQHPRMRMLMKHVMYEPHLGRPAWGFGGGDGGRGGGDVFLLEVQYSILKSLISTCVLSYVGSREDWLLDRICES